MKEKGAETRWDLGHTFMPNTGGRQRHGHSWQKAVEETAGAWSSSFLIVPVFSMKLKKQRYQLMSRMEEEVVCIQETGEGINGDQGA